MIFQYLLLYFLEFTMIFFPFAVINGFSLLLIALTFEDQAWWKGSFLWTFSFFLRTCNELIVTRPSSESNQVSGPSCTYGRGSVSFLRYSICPFSSFVSLSHLPFPLLFSSSSFCYLTFCPLSTQNNTNWLQSVSIDYFSIPHHSNPSAVFLSVLMQTDWLVEANSAFARLLKYAKQEKRARKMTLAIEMLAAYLHFWS